MMDRLTDGIRQEAPWTMMFADDIVICNEHKRHAEESLESWRQALERQGMKASRSKAEYMCVNGIGDGSSVRMEGLEVAKVNEFKYLGSKVQSDGGCRTDMKKRIHAGWNG